MEETKEKHMSKNLTREFQNDILSGLNQSPKRLSSKYFYDTRGSELFREIMNMKEYYLTDAEFEILQTQSNEIHSSLDYDISKGLDIVEFGAGDGVKTKLFLEFMLSNQSNFVYKPVDISQSVIDILVDGLKVNWPEMQVRAEVDDYFKTLERLKNDNGKTKILFFLGSNIGNYSPEEALLFLREISSKLNTGDYLLCGFDLKKDPHMIRLAYDDPHGITRQFNLNLLHRINRELEADFDIDSFGHYQSYDPQTGHVKSFIFSKKKQSVNFGVSGETIGFERWEMIQTELSRKFDLKTIEDLAAKSGFKLVKHFFDCKHYFTDSLWKVL